MQPSNGFRSVADTRLGDHVCLPVESDEERLTETAVLVRHALRCGGKILVLTHTETTDEMAAHLTDRVPGADVAIAVGRLKVRAGRQVQSTDGVFDPRHTLDRFRAECDRARQQGWSGLWVAADMAWSLSHLPGVEALGEYEASANLTFLGGHGAAVCIYDLRKFTRTLMERYCSAHPVTLGQAALRFAGADASPGLVLSGEADYTNRTALATLLTSLRSVDGHVTIDASGLRFADVHALRLLMEVRRARDHGSTTITGSRRVNRLMELALAAEPDCGGWCGA